MGVDQTSASLLDRVHRMNSVKPVNIYVVLCTGPTDRRLESLVQEKSDATELVLDGRLIGERTKEVNLAELLKVVRHEFNEKELAIDEGLLPTRWPALRQRLSSAMKQWIGLPDDVGVSRVGAVPGNPPVSNCLNTGRTLLRPQASQATKPLWQPWAKARTCRICSRSYFTDDTGFGGHAWQATILPPRRAGVHSGKVITRDEMRAAAHGHLRKNL
jgi:hypothetical protein